MSLAEARAGRSTRFGPAPLRCRIDHRVAGGTGALELHQPVEQLCAWDASEVTAILTEAEAAARRGCYVAGFVAYDAAPAFDPAMQVPGPCRTGEGPELPLAWFGLFAEGTPAPALPRTPAPSPTTGSPTTGSPTTGSPTTGSPTTTGSPEWSCEIDAGAHAAAVHNIRDAIAAGDAYLVNYTTRFRRPWGGRDDDDPFELYSRLVSGYEGGYHAYFETDEWAVACGSPELFFEHSAGRLVTRPMKGTAPRGRWAQEDTDRAAALSSSPKERAENVMVVDLVRNDLGRIAQLGSVTVGSLGDLERHPSLWQLTSTVTATVRPDVGLADVFGALFPCASVTGAPKISAMSVIAGVERSARGVYCGAVGYLAPARHFGAEDPTARFAVAIRTAVVDKIHQVAEYGSGGGITWDSAPQQEWEEVRLKARSLAGSPAPSLCIGQGLVETMGWFPDEGTGTVRNLGDHLARLTSSARYFGVAIPTGIEDLVAGAVAGLDAPTRVRLVVRSGGAEVETSPLDVAPGPVLRLCVDPVPVSSTDIGLFHKTTDRRRYEERARRHPHADDVVLVNERGEITETTRASLAVRLDGRWCTPPLDCGLLPGVGRAVLSPMVDWSSG